MSNMRSIINRISQWTGNAVVYLILLIIGIIGFDVVMRYWFHSPTIWGYELSLFIYGIHFMLGGVYCLHIKAHISMDAIYRRSPFHVRKAIDIISSFLTLAIGALLVWFGTKWAWKATLIFESSGISAWDPPIWWLKWVVVLAAGLIMLQALADLIHYIQTFIRGEETKS